jgi:hypothetical protein
LAYGFGASDPARTAYIGASSGAVVADVYPAFGDRAPELTHFGEGDIHPNAAGYAIAQTFIAAD